MEEEPIFNSLSLSLSPEIISRDCARWDKPNKKGILAREVEDDAV